MKNQTKKNNFAVLAVNMKKMKKLTPFSMTVNPKCNGVART